MPYLKTPADISASTGLKNGNNVPTGNDPVFVAMLLGATAKVERLLGTDLSLSGHEDIFVLDSRFIHNMMTFRLTAGFVDPASVTITNPFGESLNSDEFILNAEIGLVIIDRPYAGKYKVRYTAGFEVDADTMAFKGLPDWLSSLADQAAIAWHREVSVAPRVAERTSHESLLTSIYRSLAGSVYGKYDRPRDCVNWPYGTSMFAPTLPAPAAPAA